MIIIENFAEVTAQIETERGISRVELIAAVQQALVSACRKRFSEGTSLECEIVFRRERSDKIYTSTDRGALSKRKLQAKC